MHTSYSKQFNTIKRAIEYDQKEYGVHAYSSLLWNIEKNLLFELISAYKKSYGCSEIEYLDFACGTGRIASFMEDKVGNSTAIDCSEAMIELAKKKVCKTRVVCADITLPETAIEGRYDFITAFRFVLNAEPELRHAALKGLANRLKSNHSWLVFNNHSNPISVKSLMWPYHALKRRNKGYQPSGNYLTHAQVLELTEKAGLHIDRVIGYGLLGGKVAKLLPFELACKIENKLKGLPLFSSVSTCQLYVTRRLNDV